MPSSWRDAIQLYNHSSSGDNDPHQRHNLLAGRDPAEAESLVLADRSVAWLWRTLRLHAAVRHSNSTAPRVARDV